MKRKYNLTIEFDSQELMEDFRGWFLDGGGDQDFIQSCASPIEEDPNKIDVDFEGETTIMISHKNK